MKTRIKKFILSPLILFRKSSRILSDYLGSLVVRKYVSSSKKIRPFRDDDLNQVLKLYLVSFGSDNYNQIIHYSQLFRNIFYVYEIDGKIVGYLGFYVHFKIQEMKIIQTATAFSGAVDTEARGQGIFTTLYKESLSELQRNRIGSVYGFIDVNNARSLSIHDKLGYKIVQKVKGICGAENCYKVELKFMK